MNKSIFDKYHRNAPIIERYFDVNFFGVATKTSFEVPLIDFISNQGGVLSADQAEEMQWLLSSGRCLRASDQDPTMLHHDCEDFFEWMDLLTALDQSGDTFTMIEVGAGYGRWVVNAVAAANRMQERQPPKLNLHAVEINPFRLQLFQEHLKLNNIPQEQINFHLGAIDNSGNRNIFYMWPVNNLYIPVEDEAETFGNRVSHDSDLANLFSSPSDALALGYVGGKLHLVSRVSTFSLEDIVPNGMIDFMNVDIQGDEVNFVRQFRDFLLERVKCLHISTHSPEVEVEIVKMLSGSDLSLSYQYNCMSTNKTEFGQFFFIDGIQSYKNTRI